MLKQLTISGLAVVKELSLEFEPGLNVLTGETGAGKSIIVGAIGLVVAEKAGSEIVRTGEKAARIAGVFEMGRSRGVLREIEAAGIESDSDEVVVKREISSEGRTRAYLNGEPVSLNVLKRIGDLLVDFHGQHEHQSLLRKSTHVDLLDAFGSTRELRGKVWEVCLSLRQTRDELERFLSGQREVQAQIEFTRFQVSDIESAQLKEGEEERLEEERAVLANFEKLASAVREASSLLYEDELACVERLSRASKALKSVSAIDGKLEALQAELASAEIAVGEVGRSLGSYLQSLEFSPSRLDEIESRLDLIGRMKKKYGRSVAEIVQFGKELKSKLSSAEGDSTRECELGAEIQERTTELRKAAQLLIEKRRTAAKKLEREVEKELASLGMKDTKFVVELELRDEESHDVELEGKKVKVGAQGPGEVQFFISPNVGEDLRPLVRIASGGEVSRIMLALKTVLVQADAVDVMVFDEIDVGIGGKIAGVVGEKLKALSRAKQIICITHIPMIACLGDTHFFVSKEVEGGRTYASAKALGREERVKEIARMLAGDKVSETTLKQAREMLVRP
ncbi:MAG: DNA repair protein RecN [Candidatus Eisenbacteria bacterium]|nr:DNA repair protein RecN [Candidatus Eisenbacteria bacterium]